MNPTPEDIQLLREYIIVVYANRMIENKAVEINEGDLPDKEQVIQGYVEAFKRAHADYMEMHAAIMRVGFEKPAITKDGDKVIIGYDCRGHEGNMRMTVKQLGYLAGKRMSGYLKEVL